MTEISGTVPWNMVEGIMQAFDYPFPKALPHGKGVWHSAGCPKTIASAGDGRLMIHSLGVGEWRRKNSPFWIPHVVWSGNNAKNYRKFYKIVPCKLGSKMPRKIAEKEAFQGMEPPTEEDI